VCVGLCVGALAACVQLQAHLHLTWVQAATVAPAALLLIIGALAEPACPQMDLSCGGIATLCVQQQQSSGNTFFPVA